MKEVLPHRAEINNLEVQGHGIKRPTTAQQNNIELHVFGKRESLEINDTVQIEEDPDTEDIDALENLPDVVETSLMGKIRNRTEKKR